jgi:hypothetical protein
MFREFTRGDVAGLEFAGGLDSMNGPGRGTLLVFGLYALVVAVCAGVGGPRVVSTRVLLIAFPGQQENCYIGPSSC